MSAFSGNTAEGTPMTADIESLSLEDTLAYLSEIESLCRQRGLKLTVPRREVLQALLERGKPLSAYDLVASLSATRRKRVSPPTVYRALSFLVHQGFVLKIESKNAYLANLSPNTSADIVLLMCDGCGTAKQCEEPMIGRLIAKDTALFQFEVHRKTVEVQGLCKKCRSQRSKGERL